VAGTGAMALGERVFGRQRARRVARSHWRVAILAAVVMAYAILAAISQGATSADVNLNDGSVWVTRSANDDVARLNHQIDQLDAQVKPQGSAPDVLQDGYSVFSYASDMGQLRPLDVSAVTLGATVKVPPGSRVSLGGGTVTIASGGDAWVLPASGATAFDVRQKTLTGLGTDIAGYDVVAGVDGVAHAYSVPTQLLSNVTLGRAGTPSVATQHLATAPGSVHVTVTAVGSTAAVLDADHGTLTVAGQDPVTIPTTPGRPQDIEVQQPGPAASAVYVASDLGLFAVPLNGGPASRVWGAGSSLGPPAAPVDVAGCVSAAWAAPARYVYACDGGRAHAISIDGVSPGADLRFRVNRDVVVLNDQIGGDVWVRIGNDLHQVADWQQFEASLNPAFQNNQSGQGPSNFAQSNKPPSAQNVSLGARPGRTTVLPVLLFDSDPNGDVLTIASTGPIPASEGTMQIADNGTALQYTPAPGQSGSFSVPYTITDGAGGNDTATATLTVTIDPFTIETPPVQQTAPPVTVTQGKSVRFPALATWYDPEGDPFELTGATAGGGNSVYFSPGGEVTFFASGSPGPQTVDLQVTDGPGQSAHRTLTVDVSPTGQLQPPQTKPFLARATAGISTTVDPLGVDSDPNDVPLRLTSVQLMKQSAEVPGLEVVPDYQNGQIQFLAAQPGTYYLQYVASDVPPTGSGPSSAPTTVRVDVVSDTDPAPPVAMRQVATLAPGASTDVPVLDAATDPSGDVLVVQSVSAPAGSLVHASVFAGSKVHLSTAAALTATQVLTYTVSDGTRSSSAELDVLPAPLPPPPLPPVAEPISVTVPAGDVAQIDPRTVSFDPAGGTLHLVPGSVSIDKAVSSSFPGGDDGQAFIDGGIVRFRAPAQPGQVTVLYGLADPEGQVANSSIIVSITSSLTATQPPTPGPLSASVVAGSQVTIPVPLADTDPAGESVVLVGEASAPRLGQVIDVTPSTLVYQAFPQSRGTDTFQYAVRDRSGLQGNGVIRIGIAASGPVDEPPVTVPQTVPVPAGRTVTVPVLQQDFDPQGYPISFTPGVNLVLHGLPNGSASISGSSIAVQGPAAGQHGTLDYSITDGHGAQADGVLTVVGTSDPAASQPPQAQDIVVRYVNPSAAITVTVDVLAHVTDPGSASDLRLVSVTGGSGPPPTVTGAQVTIHLAQEAQVFVYTVTGTGGTASATIAVPPKGTDGPQLRPGVGPITTAENSPATVSIDSYLFDPAGRPLRLTSTADTSAVDGSIRVLSPTTFTFSPQSGYAGPASVSVRVTNGFGPDDPNGQIGFFTLPVTVTGTPVPVFYGPTISAVLGEHTSLDLSPYVGNGGGTSPTGVSFGAPSGAPSALGASIAGTTLSVFPQGSLAGSVELVSFSVTDTGGQTTGAVEIVVTSTDKPLAVAVPQTATVFQGQAVKVDVLQQDVDPFPTPLVVSQPIVTSGQGTATTDGTTITFTAGATYSGTAVVDYVLTDQTRDPTRQVHGTITITVSGVPGVPGVPGVLGFGSGTVLLSWAAPPDNGQPIDHYLVSGGGPSPQDCGTATTCSITGLSNGVTYQFQVQAHNAVGNGPLSQQSAPVTPNIVPEAPAPPTTKFGDMSETVSWTAPVDLGTPVTCYQLQISPQAGASPPCITGTTYVWSGLTNGVAYSFSVRAENSLGWGPYSSLSQPDIPAGVPSAPGAPQVAAVPNDPTGGKLDVQWPAVTGAAANGATVTSYQLTVTQGGTTVRTDTVTPTSQTEDPITYQVSGLSNTIVYTFVVTATNKAGTSKPSPPSAPFTVFGQPAAVTDLAAQGNQNHQVTLTFTPPNNNGQSIQSYNVSVSGGAWQQLATNDIVSGLANGQNYSFVIQACNTYCGAPSNSASATPDAPPSAPGVAASVSGTTFNFSWGSWLQRVPGLVGDVVWELGR